MRGASSGAQIEPVTCGDLLPRLRRSRLSSAHSILQTVSSRRRFNRHFISGAPLPRPHFCHLPSRVGGFSRDPTGSRGPASPPASNQLQLSGPRHLRTAANTW